MDKTKVFIFSDGSKESQVLEFESLTNPYITIEKIKVPKVDLWEIEACYIQKLPKSILNSNDITKVFVHFTTEDFAEHDIDKQRLEIRDKYPNLAIFYAYEQMSRAVAQLRYEGYYPKQGFSYGNETDSWPPETEAKSTKKVNKST